MILSGPGVPGLMASAWGWGDGIGIIVPILSPPPKLGSGCRKALTAPIRSSIGSDDMLCFATIVASLALVAVTVDPLPVVEFTTSMSP